jgi:hypothetical protein
MSMHIHGFVGFAMLAVAGAFLLSPTIPVRLFRCENLENVDASSSMRSLEDNFGGNAYLVPNSLLG